MFTGSCIFRFLPVSLVFCSVLFLNAGEKERFWLDAKINNKRARICFDSGSNRSFLTKDAAKKLGLHPSGGPINIGNAVSAEEIDEVTLSLEGTKCKTSFLVLNVPAFARPNFDGGIGWPTLSQNVTEIDAVAKGVTFLEKVPKRTAQWTRFPIITNFSKLDLQIASGTGTADVLCIDTGDPRGLSLSSREWKQWKQAHPQTPITLDTGFTPTSGFFVHEEAWADEISVGPEVLKGVPVAQSGPANEKLFGSRYKGTLGVAGLKRLDFIVDGKGGFAYLRPKTAQPPAYNHNRLGAVFVPTSARTNQAVAQVVEGGPAHDAGVRDGDVLLQVDEVVVKSWSDTWRDRFRLRAGTKLKLTLQRYEKVFETTATLREIVKPDVTRNELPSSAR